jgi:hypothetical protein
MEARLLKAGRREYVQVLRLMETFDLDEVHGAVKTALRMGADSDEAGGAFQTEAGHPFRFHSGRRSDLKPALSEPDPGSH